MPEHDTATHRTSPPVAPRRPSVTELHGVRRVDDYAWLAESGSPDVHAYLAAERRYYDARTAHSRPLQDRLFGEMSGRTLPADSSVSWSRGGPVYYTRTVAGKEYTVFCASDCDLPAHGSSEADDERVLLDVNAAAEGHEYADLGVCDPSPDGERLAWSLDTMGNEHYTLWIRDIGTGSDHQVAEGTYLTSAWSADSGTFFYTRLDSLNRVHQVWRHTCPSDASPGGGGGAGGAEGCRDELVVDEGDARFELTLRASRSGELILIETRSRETTEVRWVPAESPATPAQVVWPRRTGIEYVVDHVAGDAGHLGDLLVVTNDGAPEFRVVRVRLADSDPARAVEVLPGDETTRWESVDVIGRYAVVGGRRDALPFLHVLDLLSGGGLDVLAQTPVGTLRLARNEDPSATAVRVKVDSLVEPPRWYDVDLASGDRTLVKTTEVPTYSPDRYVTERFWATARDGEQVPVSLARHADTPLDGSAPCLIWSYGAYESTDWPEFDPTLPSLLDRGVVYALAHLRGGGERGRRWWEAGRKAAKTNTFSDLVAVADALGDGLVDGTRIVTRGLSAGGLLQGAAMGLAPRRWAAVVAEVPFVDCVTSMLDENLPLTINEYDEWGDPHDPDDFAVLLAYAPYENPPPGYRPPLLVTGSVNDARVMVREPAKWVARLRATAGPEASEELLFRVELGAGAHTGPAGRYSHLHYEAEVHAYILGIMGT